MRRYGLSNTAGIVTQDYENKGIAFKKGDMMPKCLYELDDRVNVNPQAVDFHRKPLSIKRAAFGAGPHTSPGAALARVKSWSFSMNGCRLFRRAGSIPAGRG